MPKFKKSTRGFKMKAGKEGPFRKNFPNDIGSPNKILGGLLAGGVGKLAAKALGNKKIRRGIGKVGGTALQAFGGPLGGMLGKAMGGALPKKSAYKKEKKKRYLHPREQQRMKDKGVKLKRNWDPVTGEDLGSK